jgi:hypothetical protein
LGVFDKEGLVSFKTDSHKAGACISDNGNIQIKTIRLDNILAKEKVTFIKMDIEFIAIVLLWSKFRQSKISSV